MSEEDRLRLLHGPYRPPRVKPGAALRCEVRGTLVVAGFSDGPIPWPVARNDGNGAHASMPSRTRRSLT